MTQTPCPMTDKKQQFMYVRVCVFVCGITSMWPASLAPIAPFHYSSTDGPI